MHLPHSVDKGDALDEAVKAIESTILYSTPGFSEGTFRIEGKKMNVVSGLRDEIDLFVRASLATGYEAIPALVSLAL
jgi:hypothetical protein